MYLKLNGKSWFIKRAPSIYTNRNGCEDTRVMAESGAHGAKREDGKRYEIIVTLASESGEFLRNYGAIPKEISMEFLLDNGFIDKIPEVA